MGVAYTVVVEVVLLFGLNVVFVVPLVVLTNNCEPLKAGT